MEHKPNLATFQSNRTSVLFSDFQNLQRIWTHPRVMRYNSDRYEIAAQKKVERIEVVHMTRYLWAFY